MPNFSATSTPPSSAHLAGSQAWNIHRIAAHIAPTLKITPIHGRPSNSPSASTAPWPGGYFEQYVGSQLM